MPPKQLATLLGGGLEVTCCPATVRSGEPVMPSSTTQINLQRFSHVAHHAAGRGERVVGLLNTLWDTGRIVAGTETLGLALGGAWFDDPRADPLTIATAYAESAFGLPSEAAEAVGGAIIEVSCCVPNTTVLGRLLGLNDAETPGNPLTHYERREAEALAASADAAADTMRAHQRGVVRREMEYGGYLLAAEFTRWAADLAAARTDGYPSGRAEVLRERGEALHARLLRQWGHYRHDDDPKRDRPAGRMGKFHILPMLRRTIDALPKESPASA